MQVPPLTRRAALRLALRVSAGIIAAFVATVTHAQTAAPTSQVVRFSVFSPQRIKDLTFAPRPGGAPQTLAFQPTARSVRYEYRGAMPLRFLDGTTGAVLAEATVPPAMREALLLFTLLPTPTAQGLKYQIAVLDDSVARQVPGTLAIINLSGLTLAGTVGKEAVKLKAGLNPAITIGRTAAVTFRATHNNRSVQSYAGNVQLTARQRALLILFPPFNKGSLEAQSRLLIDDPQPGKKAGG